MNINISDFTQDQRQTLLDLLVLAMYSDGHLAGAENAAIEEVLSAMGLSNDHDRRREIDASVTRIRPHTEKPENIRAYVSKLALDFPRRDHRRRVSDLLSELMASDSKVAPRESLFLSNVKEVFYL